MQNYQVFGETLKKTQTLELINEFEEEFSVETWEVEGMKIWPAVRIPLIAAWEKKLYYSDGTLDAKPSSKLKRFFHEYLLLVRSAAKALHSFFNRTKADVGVWGLDVERVKANGSYYTPYGDALRDLERDSGLKFLCFDLTIKKFITSHYPCIDVSFGYNFARIVSRFLFLLKRKKKYQIDLDRCRAWCKERNLPSSGLNEKYLFTQFYTIRSLKNQYKRLVRRHSLKVCFVVCWYGQYGMALSSAAKELSVPCFDLQHGIAGASSSRVYSNWGRVPSGGYDLIPGGFWCWTDEDALAIEKWGSSQTPPIRTVVGGCVWQRLWLEEKQPREIFRIAASTDRLLDRAGTKILFTMQGNEPPQVLFDLLENSPSEWNWWIRCHPTKIGNLDELEEKLSAFSRRVNLKEVSLTHLPLLLGKADVHITGWSAVTYDALCFGLKTILVHPSAKQFFEPLILTAQVFYLEKCEEILSFIQSSQKDLRFDCSSSKYESVKDLLRN